jgi:hypothetical protein
MRIRLDQNFPADFVGPACIKNGDLLRRAHSGCDVFVTLDRNLEFPQNLKVLSFGVVVVRSQPNRIKDL